MRPWRRSAGTLAAFVAAVALLAFAAPTRAQERVAEYTLFGPFAVTDGNNRAVTLFDPLDDGAAQAFSDLLAAFPTIEVVVLSHTGGSLVEAVVIAEMIRAHRITTGVLPTDRCGLPCSVLLMAGVGRALRGTLILEANPDDPPFIRPLVEDRLVAYGAPPEFLAAVHDAWAGRPRTIGPGDIAAIEVGSAEGRATIPPPLPPVPFTGPLLPFEPVGNVVTGLFQRADFAAADRSVRETGADAAWVVSPTPGLPSVRAIVIEPGTSRFLTATFVMAPQRAGFDFDIFIDVNDIESPTSILGVFASPAEGTGVALFGLVPDHDDLRMQFPTVLLDHNASAILDAATITVMLYGPEQQTLFVTFAINDEARAAFAAAFATSRD